jgi:HlyD family secretion protein
LRKFSRRNWIIAGALVLLVAVLVAYQLLQVRAAVPVTTATAETDDMKVTVSASASTASSSEVALNFDGSGRLEQLYVSEGELVTAGQVLARQDDSQLTAQLKQARAGLRTARANLSKLRAGATGEEIAVSQAAVDSASISLEAAKRKLTEVQSQAAQDAAIAQVSVDNAKTSRDFTLGVREAAARDYLDLVKKYEHPVLQIPNYTAAQEAEVDAAKATADAAMNTYLAAETTYKNALENKKNIDAKNQTAIQAAQDVVNSANSSHQSALAQLNLKRAAPRSQDLQVARDQVEQAQATLEIAQKNLDNATLKSPARGRVISVTAEEGEFVAGGAGGLSTSALITLADLQRAQVVADVDETDVGRVKLGQEAEVALDAFPERSIKGRVIEVGYLARQTEAGGTALPVKISLDETKGIDVRKDMNADVNIVVSVKEDVLSVPLEAVIEKEGRDVVYLIEKGRARARRVRLGLATDEAFEIVRGLKRGETVAVKNVERLREGDRVRLQ